MGIGLFLGQEKISLLQKYNNTTLKLPAGSHLLVGGLGVTCDSDLFCTTSNLDIGTITANTLYYVYLVVSNNTPSLVLSLSKTGPSGYLSYRLLAPYCTDFNTYLADPFIGVPFTQVIEGTVSNPTKGVITVDKSTWFIDKNFNLNVDWVYRQTAGGVVGSGIYLPRLPWSFLPDPNKHSYSISGGEQRSGNSDIGISSISNIDSFNGASCNNGIVRLYDQSRLLLILSGYDVNANRYSTWSSSYFNITGLINVSMKYSLAITTPDLFKV